MNKTKLESHIAHLEQQHADLDKQIIQGYSRYLADSNLNKAKQEKLLIKRQLNEYMEKLTKL